MLLASFSRPTDLAAKLDVLKLPCKSSCSSLDDNLLQEYMPKLDPCPTVLCAHCFFSCPLISPLYDDVNMPFPH